jgi:predicted ATPase
MHSVPTPPEIARLMPQLLRLFPDLPPPLEIPPEQSRRLLFNAVAEVLTRTAGNRPVLLLLEDLHWADEGTLSLLNHLARLTPKIPVVIVATYRDHDLDPGGSLAATLDELTRLHLAQRIALDGLAQPDVAEMIRGLSDREPPKTVVDLIYSGTEGNPFFVEELFLHLVERGKLTDSNGEFRSGLKLAEIDVPQSLRLVIGRRLSRLGDGTLKILATAAVIGRSFSFELLEASTRMDVDSLLDSVEEAEKAALISSTLQYHEARFQFSHELIRQTVLGEISAARRQRLHLGAADAIERLHAADLEDYAEDLAHHLRQAGAAADTARTVHYLAMAAKQAMTRSAILDAIEHLTRGLDLLQRRPGGGKSIEQELSLQQSLGMALAYAKGYSAIEAQQAFARPADFAVKSGNRRTLHRRCWGCGLFICCAPNTGSRANWPKRL